MPNIELRRRIAAEPTRRIPLRWGEYDGRYVGGVILLIAGAACIAQTTAYTLSLGLLGSALHACGWIVQPARGWTRAAAVGPSLFACWITITGPKSIWLLTLVFVCWLAVRRRPLLAYALAIVPFAVGVGLASTLSYADEKVPAFLVMLGAIVAAAWLARQLALRLRFR